jgi:hypothetical protein
MFPKKGTQSYLTAVCKKNTKNVCAHSFTRLRIQFVDNLRVHTHQIPNGMSKFLMIGIFAHQGDNARMQAHRPRHMQQRDARVQMSRVSSAYKSRGMGTSVRGVLNSVRAHGKTGCHRCHRPSTTVNSGRAGGGLACPSKGTSSVVTSS